MCALVSLNTNMNAVFVKRCGFFKISSHFVANLSPRQPGKFAVVDFLSYFLGPSALLRFVGLLIWRRVNIFCFKPVG